MLVLKSLEVEGFGPFADRQRLDFGPPPGVTVIYGDNMRGKTTLLNAIRFAFYGHVVGRMLGAEPRRRRLRSVVNRDLAADGIFRFSVVLTFEFDGQPYELVRTCEPLGDDPQDDSEFEIETLVRCGGRALGPQEKDRLLATVLPTEIARFFLFDGELLQEYEQLLLADSADGKKISGAIERILGVPVLKQGQKHLREMADDAVRTAGREAAKNIKTQALGNALQLAAEEKRAHVAERDRLLEEQGEALELKAEAEARLSSYQRLHQIVDRLSKARDALSDAENDQREAMADLRRTMSVAWRTLLREPIRLARSAAQAAAERQYDELVSELRRRAVQRSHCEVCDQAVPIHRHAALLSSVASRGPSAASAKPLLTLKELNAIEDEDRSGEVRAIWTRLQAAGVRAKAAKDEVDDCEEALKGGKGEDVAIAQADYSKILDRLASLKAAIERAEEKVAETDARISELNQKLRNTAGGDLGEAEARAALLSDAAAVFGEAVERYKNALRVKVEATASDLFLAMTTEKTDYASLTINESYGLTIRHHDGQAEEARSAGAEHVVALALMGALQRNAPLQGPIVMDSPFGRLDAGHTDNIVAALPRMADQTVLLVHENEVDRSRVRELLKGRLRREYSLERISARRTRIRQVTT